MSSMDNMKFWQLGFKVRKKKSYFSAEVDKRHPVATTVAY